MTIEISESGVSLATAATLEVGETVELQPIAEGPASAVVRHTLGRVYGFEFANLTGVQVEEIRRTCLSLPQFNPRSLNI